MRLKMIAGNLVVVLLMGLAGYLLVRGQLKSALDEKIDGRISSDAQLLARSLRLSGNELAQYTLDRTQTSQVRQALLGVGGVDQRRTRAFGAAQEVAAWFGNPARRGEKPDIVVIADETGRVVARDTDKNRMFGQSLLKEVPELRSVLTKGVARADVWSRDGKLLQLGIAPVRSPSGSQVGALLVGYDLSNGFAKGEAARLGREVLLLSDKGVYSASTPVAIKKALGGQLFDKFKAATQAALDGKTSSPWTTRAAGKDYVGVTGALPNARATKAAFAVVADKTEGLSLASIANLLPLLALLGALGVIAYGSIVANSLMRPLEKIEEDVLGVINGQTNLRVDIDSEEFGGLAYRINQLINLFTGVAEEDEHGRAVTSSGAWQAIQAEEGRAPATPIDPGDQALADEPDAQYYSRLYREYVSAKRAAGEDVSNITEDRFVMRLKGNESHLRTKHGGAKVRFKVVSEGGQVDLRPVILS